MTPTSEKVLYSASLAFLVAASSRNCRSPLSFSTMMCKLPGAGQCSDTQVVYALFPIFAIPILVLRRTEALVVSEERRQGLEVGARVRPSQWEITAIVIIVAV